MKKTKALQPQVARIAVPSLPAGMEGARFLLLSDLHMHGPAPVFDELLSFARAATPNCILCCGDVIDEGTRDVGVLRPFFAALRQVAPVVAVNGNNDAQPRLVAALRGVYAACGVTLLEDDERLFCVGGGAVRLVGMQDPAFYAKRLHIERPGLTELEARMRGIRPFWTAGEEGACALIVLVHRPELAESFLWMHPALIVAGHAHGGQMRAFGRGLYAPGQGIFPRYTSGVYRLGEAQLAVCRGIGNHAFVPRVNNPPHAMLLWLSACRGE